jgi:hypothetical protein
MPTRRTHIALAALVMSALAAAPAAGAPRAEYAQVSSYIPARIDSMIGFIPSHGMNPPGRAPRVTTVRYGGKTFRFFYANSAAVWPDTGLILSTLSRRYASTTAGAFVDRRLTARQRKRLAVRVDLGRDADVLVVARDHPVCSAGLTTSQARGIARGSIERWSQVVDMPAGARDAIAVRVEKSSTGGKVPRWGVRDVRKYAIGARGAADGGLGQAAAGDHAVAGLTSWTRARSYGRTVCSVPIDGVAPTDATVFALSYPAAFPISYVVPRFPFRASRLSRAMMKGFVDWLRAADAADQFRAHGMMLVADGPPAPALEPTPQDDAPPLDAIIVEEPPPDAVEVAGPEG